MFPTILPETITAETLELRDVIESGVDIWAFDYPSYYTGDEKKAFEEKVNKHFWTRQIGQETVGRFLLYFRRTMREIMPYYVQRYNSVDMLEKDPDIKPLDNYNMVEEFESSRAGTNTSTSTGTNTSTSTGSTADKTTTGAGGVNVMNETPQGALSMEVDTTGEVLNLQRASSVEQRRDVTDASGESTVENTTTGSENATVNGSDSGTETHRLTRRGNIGVTTYSQLVQGYRETFLNIDMEIISELESCFLGVY